jgi:hypothetical protein
MVEFSLNTNQVIDSQGIKVMEKNQMTEKQNMKN